MVDASMKQLELAWEAIQEIYPTEANIQAYLGGIQEFCSYAEDTHLIRISHRKVAAYYDKEQMNIASEKRLQDFISPEWATIFKDKASKALAAAQGFTEQYHLGERKLTREELFQVIREGSKINIDLFVVFESCQPQYSARLESYIKSLLLSPTSDDVKDEIVTTLSLPLEINPLTEEEILWTEIVQDLQKKFPEELPSLNEYPFSELEQHARRHGLIYAADGHLPWQKEDLYARLQTDFDKSISDIRQEVNQKKTALQKRQKELIDTYQVPPQVVELCKVVADVGHLRLCVRVKGWMPVVHVLMNELFPRLEDHLPYTAKQLKACRHQELMSILHGDHRLNTTELDRRDELVFFGIVDGKEVLWSGKEAEKKIKQYIPIDDLNATELNGQVAMKGNVKGKCHVLRWDAENVTAEIEAMPSGAILVAGQTRPQLMPAIRKAAAIITDEGGITSHAAIVSRELGIPCIIGTKFATKIIKTGDTVRVDANAGIVYLVKEIKSTQS